MVDSTRSGLFIFLIAFWTLMTLLSNAFHVTTLESDLSALRPNKVDQEESGFKSFVSGLFDTLEEIPVIEYFVPLFKIVTFQYTDQVPALMSVFLLMMSILSVFVGYTLVRSG